MARIRRIIRRESENETCSRRDPKDEPSWHPSNRGGPPRQASSKYITHSDGEQYSGHATYPVRQDRQGDHSLPALFDFLGALKCGKVREDYPKNLLTFSLPLAKFEELEERLQKDPNTSGALGHWYSRRVRYDYDAGPGRYTLRMPTAVHECFTASVVNAVEHAIDELVRRLQSRKGKGRMATVLALKRIFKGGSTTVELHDSEADSGCKRSMSDAGLFPIRRSPDASFYHGDTADLPQLVLEIGYSQQRDGLERIAESYIVDSRHAIRCVLGFDIPYLSRPGSPGSRSHLNRDRTATVSIWRPAITSCGVGISQCHADALPFRSDDGAPAPGELPIFLGDILPPDTLATLPKDTASIQLHIPLATLGEALDNAERCQATIWDPPSRPSPVPTPSIFLKRKRTPSPELCDEHEEHYARLEEDELKRNQKTDRAYRSPSGNRFVWHDVKRRRSPRLTVKIKSEPEAG